MEKRLYGVSIGNGNDGVSQSFPSYYCRTDDPYRLARLALVSEFAEGARKEVVANMIIDGEASHTISASLLDPPGDVPDYQNIAERHNYSVEEVGESIELFAWVHGHAEVREFSDPYATEAEAWKACVEENDLEIPRWSDGNGSYRIAEIFPVENEPAAGRFEKPIYEGLEAAFADDLLALVKSES